MHTYCIQNPIFLLSQLQTLQLVDNEPGLNQKVAAQTIWGDWLLNTVNNALAKQLDHKKGREIATFQATRDTKGQIHKKASSQQARNEHIKHGDTKEKQKINW